METPNDENSLKEKLSKITETKTLTIDGEEIECKIVDPNDESLFPSTEFDASPDYIKTAEIQARQATEAGTLTVKQDGLTYNYEAGDWLIKNPSGESEYIFGDVSSTNVETRNTKFNQTYKALDGKPGTFISAKPPFKAIIVRENIAFEKWGDWQGIKAGGVMTRQFDGGRYGIDQTSFEADYGTVESQSEQTVEKELKETSDEVKNTIQGD